MSKALTFEGFDSPPQGAQPSGGALTFEEFEQPESNMGTLGNIGMGALSGAANIGATLLTPVDWALNKAGLSDTTPTDRRRALQDFFTQQADPESLAFRGGELGSEVAGTLGVGGGLARGVRALAPSLTKLPTALETWGATVGGKGATGAERLGNAALRLGAGATAGGASAGLVDPGSVGTGAAIGAVMPVVGAGAGQAVKGTGWLLDAVRGRLGKVKAAQIARDAAGPELAAIQAANQVAPGGVTAGQAAYGIDRDTWQALAKLAEKNDMDSYYRVLRDAQEAGRMGTLQRITPDLAQAQAARKAAADVNYPAAEQVMFKADPALLELSRNPYFKKAQAAAGDLLESQGVTFKTNPTAYLNTIKFGFDKILSGTGDSALSGAEKKVVYDLKNRLMGWMEQPSKNPLYKAAREEHARLSGPINQAQVLEQMQAVLQRGGGGERAQPFLDVLGRGENALLKRADQSPRFGGIEDVLTPEQLAAAQKVSGELSRDRTLAEQATAGEGGLRRIMDQDSGLLRLPSLISAKFSAANRGLDVLENRISRATLSALVQGMRSGADANALLSTVPAHERNAVMLWVARGGHQRYLGPASSSQAAE
jgi:hypothetical protein